MRATRIRKRELLAEIPPGTRDPLDDPLYGDIVEGMDGERRFVEIRQHNRARHVHYRSAGASQTLSPLPNKCTLSAWRHWAKGGQVLCTTPTRARFDSTSRRPVFTIGHGTGMAL